MNALAPAHAHTHTHTHKYVILIAFPQQQRFHERASTLRYTYVASLVINNSGSDKDDDGFKAYSSSPIDYVISCVRLYYYRKIFI